MQPGSLNNTIALVIRGGCKFAEKVINAQAAGARAVLVMNVDPSQQIGAPLVVMSASQADSDRIHVPAAFIRYVDGEALLDGPLSGKTGDPLAVLNGTGSVDPSFKPSDARSILGNVFFFLLEVFIGIWAAIGICFATIWCKRIYDSHARERAIRRMRRRRFRKSDVTAAGSCTNEEGTKMMDDAEDNDGEDLRVNLMAADMEKQRPTQAGPTPCCPVAGPSTGTGRAEGYDQESCVICLCDFEEGDQLMVLPCLHEFHVECIRPWLLNKSSLCPICKQNSLPRAALLPSERDGAAAGAGGDGAADEDAQGADGEGAGEAEVAVRDSCWMRCSRRPGYRCFGVLAALVLVILCVVALVIFMVCL